jgi:hypothetical protein
MIMIPKVGVHVRKLGSHGGIHMIVTPKVVVKIFL